jgi:hypothetical protein
LLVEAGPVAGQAEELLLLEQVVWVEHPAEPAEPAEEPVVERSVMVKPGQWQVRKASVLQVFGPVLSGLLMKEMTV